MSFKKGQIRNKERSTQVLDYSGVLRMRGITPTDIDGLIDYGGKSFIYIEGKLYTAPFLKGQRMALENLVDSHNKAGHKSTAIIFRHDTPVKESVKVAECKVDKVYFDKKWSEPKNTTVLQFIEKWEKKFIL